MEGAPANGNWKVYNHPAIEDGDLDWWAQMDEDPLGGFADYPKHWALAAEGHLDLGPAGALPVAAGDLFVFGYWPGEPVDSDLNWDTVDGSTHVWVGRVRTLGRGEGSSGLRFDELIAQSQA